MASCDRLLNLLVQWEEGRHLGKAPSAEELCPDDLELQEILRQRIRQRERFGPLWDSQAETRPGPLPAGSSHQESSEILGKALPASFGRYRLDRRLGQGGMGEVFLAYDNPLGREVALKIPRYWGPGAGTVRARFLREAQAAAALVHPNICPIHDLGEIDGVPFLTMPFLRGQPLSERIDPERPFLPVEAVALVAKVARALEVAHQGGIIHRDLKPRNVMIDERGQPIVMDFGLARRENPDLPLTQQGEILGTPSYMSPEQFAGDLAQQGPASDIYSLGIILYELLTGVVPFRGDLLALACQVSTDIPLPPSQRRPGLDPRLDQICLCALAKRPGDRWPSMRAFAEALEAFGQEATSQAESLTLPPAVSTPDLLLVLRLEGTPVVYRPAPGQQVITLGRQIRKLGAGYSQGNDLVLRVPNNPQLSLRISRRHLEIRRQGEEYVAIDRSKGGTSCNGQPLAPNVPWPLRDGDRLVVAGLITLGVSLTGPRGVRPTLRQVQVPTSAPEGGKALLEVSLGDLVTVE